MKTREWISTILALAAILGSVALPFWYERQKTEAASERTITLTGVASSGIWTEDQVTGDNYRKNSFKPARIRLNKGESVRLILRSADVTHRFYMPELGVGPVDLIPGHTEEVHFKADKEGVFNYYCTEICGDCHFHMRGFLTVGGPPLRIPPALPATKPTTVPHPLFPIRLRKGVTGSNPRDAFPAMGWTVQAGS